MLGLDRTYEELKLQKGEYFFAVALRLDRTYEELKPGRYVLPLADATIVWIVPMRN